MKIATIGLDLAKSVFHVVCFDEKHKEVGKKMLRRSQVLEYFIQLEQCLVARACPAKRFGHGGMCVCSLPGP